jgi:hypothetical protein
MEDCKLAITFAIIALLLALFTFIWLWSCRDSFISLGAFKVVEANFCLASKDHPNKETLYEPANTVYNAFPKTPGTYELHLNGSEENCPGKQLWVINNGCEGSVIEVHAGCGVKIIHSNLGHSVPAGGSSQYLIIDINTFRRVA